MNMEYGYIRNGLRISTVVNFYVFNIAVTWNGKIKPEKVVATL